MMIRLRSMPMGPLKLADRVMGFERKFVRFSVFVPIMMVFLLGGPVITAAQAAENGAGTEDPAMTDAQPEDTVTEIEDSEFQDTIGGNNQDPSVMLQEIQKRRTERASLFKVAPLKPLHDGADTWHENLYHKTHIKLGTSVHHLFQWLSESLPGTDDWGTATDLDIIGTWEAINRGEPTQGSLTLHLESRWNWGTTGPMALGPGSLGMLQNTGNTFDKYVPVTIMRNLYWQTGGVKSKGAIRFGKVTIDGILGTTRHLTPNTSCLTFACTGAFAIALPDSGLGVVGAWHFNDRVKLLGAVTDANGNRFNMGDIGEGDFFTALDLGIKIWPKTEKAGFSKFTLWHSDGTSDGKAINGSTGKEGWGYYLLHEQEITRDGNMVAIFKYGRSHKDSAFFRRQASASLLVYEPSLIGTISNDATGISLNWVEPTAEGSREESNVEIWYRFPMFPGVDTTFSYMAVINPALDRSNDFASVFSFRLVTVF